MIRLPNQPLGPLPSLLVGCSLALVVGGLAGGPAGSEAAAQERSAEEGSAEEGSAEENSAEESSEEGSSAEESSESAAEAEESSEPEEIYEPEEQWEEETAVPRTLCQGRQIRQVRIRGNRRVSNDDVLATIHLRDGQVCSETTVARDARALWEMGFFDDIVVESTPRGRRVDLTFRVRERPAIGRITYEGNDEVEDSDLEEEVQLRIGGILSLTEVREQITRIRDVYADKGYFLARVGYRLRRMRNNQVDVVFQVTEGDQVAVRRVRFVGNRRISDSELRGILRTRQSNFFSFLANDNRFNTEHFEEDTTRLQAYYYGQGYLAMRVGTPRIELTPDRRHIEVTIPVTEGPRFRIGRLVIREQDDDGNEVEPLGGRRRVREMIDANPGDWFDRQTIAVSLQRITGHYRNAGFARVQVEPQTDLNMERRMVNLSLVIQRGPPVRIERIDIRGNTKTRDSVIRREFPIAEGELYNQGALEEGRARVLRLGYFERVELSESDGSAPDRIVVTVEIAERATGTFQVGAGFSSIESFILTAQVNQQNLFGNGQSLSLQLQLSGIRQLVQIQIGEPYFFNTQWSFGLNLFKTVRQYQDFTRDSTGGSFSFGHPILDNRLRLTLGYRADYVEIGGRTGSLFGAQPGAQGLIQIPRLPIANLFRSGLTSSVSASLTWDSRDNRLFPTDGFYASLSAEAADEYIGSANTYLRSNLEVRAYYPIMEGVVLRFRTDAGIIASRQDTGVPNFERFRLGGIFNVRGFPINSLGPRLGLPRTTDPNARIPDAGVPIGGNLQFFYNLELEFPIIQEVNIRGVIFTDGGNAWNTESALCGALAPQTPIDSSSNPCTVNPFDIRTSWGFGIRWVSPLGPLRFEWGIPFDRRPYEREIDFQFTIGNFF